jgi:predicted ATPase
VGATLCWLGEFIAGRAYLEKALALYDPAHGPSSSELLSYDSRVELRLHLSFPLACLGHLDQALLQRDEALAGAGRLSHPPTLAHALMCAWFTGWFARSSAASLLQYADQTLSLATEHGLEFFRATALLWRGWCLAALRRAEEGVPLLSAGLAGRDELGHVIWRPLALSLLGDSCRMADKLQAALGHLAEARHLAETTGEQWFHAEMLRLTGEVMLATGDPAAAEASYRAAIAVAQQQSAKLWELCAAISLARLWRDQSKRAEARDLLAPVYSWFTEGFGTPVLQEARALLAELAA